MANRLVYRYRFGCPVTCDCADGSGPDEFQAVGAEIDDICAVPSGGVTDWAWFRECVSRSVVEFGI